MHIFYNYKKTMLNVFILATVLSSTSVTAALDNIPPLKIKNGGKSVLTIYTDDKKGHDAIRISEEYILSAAHCFRGYEGNEKNNKASYCNKKQDCITLEIVEEGKFDPFKGQMEDWILLRPKNANEIEKIKNISIADFPSKEKIVSILSKLGSFDKRKSGVAIWSVTSPAVTFRMFPRPGTNGKEIFYSKGYIKNDDAYKKYILFTALKNQFYDEIYSHQKPEFKVNINEEWLKLKESNLFRWVFQLYLNYENSGDPILYNTADFSNGSSGGGYFLEDTGELIGIVSMGTHLAPASVVYFGIGSLYRIDSICKQSKFLSKLEKCGNLLEN